MVYSVIIYIYNNIVRHKVLEPISAGLNCIIFGMEQERTIGGERKKKKKKKIRKIRAAKFCVIY